MAVVCAIHFGLISSFLNAGKSGQSARGSATSLRFQIIAAQPPIPQVQDRSEPQSATDKPSEKTAAAPGTASLEKKSSSAPGTTEKASSDPLPFFNRDRFLDAGDLDQSAAASKAFEDTLEKSLPAGFDLIVLEFLIDESGQTVQLTCIDGDCSTELAEKLQQLVALPFTPATKNGQPVASRKVIQISPTPTFGL